MVFCQKESDITAELLGRFMDIKERYACQKTILSCKMSIQKS